MSGTRRKIGGSVISYYCIAFAVLLADQATKLCALRSLDAGESVPVIPGIFHLTLVFNTGAAFGLLRGRPQFFALFAVPAAVAMIYFLGSASLKLNVPERTAISFMLGGTLGNLTDRILYGHVTDFLDFRVWPVFNIADSFITIGAVLLGLSMLVRSGRHGN